MFVVNPLSFVESFLFFDLFWWPLARREGEREREREGKKIAIHMKMEEGYPWQR